MKTVIKKILLVVAAIAVIVGIYKRNKYITYIDQRCDLEEYIDHYKLLERCEFCQEIYDELLSEMNRLYSCKTSKELNAIAKKIDEIEDKIIAHEIIGGN